GRAELGLGYLADAAVLALARACRRSHLPGGSFESTPTLLSRAAVAAVWRCRRLTSRSALAGNGGLRFRLLEPAPGAVGRVDAGNPFLLAFRLHPFGAGLLLARHRVGLSS